eukprot:UN02547
MATTEPDTSNDTGGWVYRGYNPDDELPLSSQLDSQLEALLEEEEQQQPSIWDIRWESDEEDGEGGRKDGGYDDEDLEEVYNPATALTVIFGTIATVIGVFKFYDWYSCDQPNTGYITSIKTRMRWQEPVLFGCKFPFWRLLVRSRPRSPYKDPEWLEKQEDKTSKVYSKLKILQRDTIDRNNMQRILNRDPTRAFARGQEAYEARRAFGTLHPVDTQAEYQPRR